MDNLTSFERFLVKYYLEQKLAEMKYNHAVFEKKIQLEKIIKKIETF